MATDFLNQKSDVRKQLERATRELNKLKAEAEKPKSDFRLGAWLDRMSLEIAVHIPVGVAIFLSCFGAQEYGAFAPVFMAISVAFSWLLSRVLTMVMQTHRLDVCIYLVVLGALAFCWESYWVHLGLERFNHQSAASGLMTFDASAIVVASITLGLFNVFSRRAFITGHDKAANEASRVESWWRFNRRRAKFEESIARNDEPVRLRDIADDVAVECYRRNGGWPLGYVPTEAAKQAVTA